MEAEVALAHAHARNLTSASTIRRQAHEEILAHLMSRGVDTPKSPPIHAAFKLGPRPEVPNANQATQNHVKLPNIQTLAQSLPKFPLVKTETVDHPPATSAAITTEAKAEDGAIRQKALAALYPHYYHTFLDVVVALSSDCNLNHEILTMF